MKQEIGGKRRAALSNWPLGGSRGKENSLHHFNVGSATFGQVVLDYIKKRQTTELKKILTSYRSEKTLISRIT